ncbi:hypothetical protein FXW78_22730 [Rhodococcus opacus]|nr:hypothetical protein [Rhodococcus opacus]
MLEAFPCFVQAAGGQRRLTHQKIGCHLYPPGDIGDLVKHLRGNRFGFGDVSGQPQGSSMKVAQYNTIGRKQCRVSGEVIPAGGYRRDLIGFAEVTERDDE